MEYRIEFKEQNQIAAKQEQLELLRTRARLRVDWCYTTQHLIKNSKISQRLLEMRNGKEEQKFETCRGKDAQFTSAMGLIAHLNKSVVEMTTKSEIGQKKSFATIRKRFEHTISVQTLPIKQLQILISLQENPNGVQGQTTKPIGQNAIIKQNGISASTNKNLAQILVTSNDQIPTTSSQSSAAGSKKSSKQLNLSLGKQALIEQILAAHFLADKKIEKNLSVEQRARNIQQLISQKKEEELLCILKSCVNPEMIYYLFSLQTEQVFGEWKNVLNRLQTNADRNSKSVQHLITLDKKKSQISDASAAGHDISGTTKSTLGMRNKKGVVSKCKSENHKTEDGVSRGEDESLISPQDKLEESIFQQNPVQNQTFAPIYQSIMSIMDIGANEKGTIIGGQSYANETTDNRVVIQETQDSDVFCQGFQAQQFRGNGSRERCNGLYGKNQSAFQPKENANFEESPFFKSDESDNAMRILQTKQNILLQTGHFNDDRNGPLGVSPTNATRDIQIELMSSPQLLMEKHGSHKLGTMISVSNIDVQNVIHFDDRNLELDESVRSKQPQDSQSSRFGNSSSKPSQRGKSPDISSDQLDQNSQRMNGLNTNRNKPEKNDLQSSTWEKPQIYKRKQQKKIIYKGSSVYLDGTKDAPDSLSTFPKLKNNETIRKPKIDLRKNPLERASISPKPLLQQAGSLLKQNHEESKKIQRSNDAFSQSPERKPSGFIRFFKGISSIFKGKANQHQQ